MTANEIWRIDPDGGEPQRVAGDLGVPDAVKFDADGYIVSTQVPAARCCASTRAPASRPCWPSWIPAWTTSPSSTAGCSSRTSPARSPRSSAAAQTRTVLPGGLNWPMDLTVGDDGRLYVADGTYFYAVAPDGALQTVGMLFSPGLPGLPARLGRRGRRRVRRDHLGWPGRALPARGERNRLSGRRTSTSSTAWRSGRAASIVVAELGTGRVHVAAVGQCRDAGLRSARSGRRGVRPGRHGAGRRVGRGPGRAG